MTKPKAAPAAATPSTPAVAPEAAVVEGNEATEVATFGDLTVLSHNTFTVIDNTDVVEDELFAPGEEIVSEAEVNGFTVIEYK